MRHAVKWGHSLVFLLLVRCSDGTPPANPVTDSGADVPKPTYTIEQLKDPATCKECHAKHYRDWSGSMHAYASDDPLFLAMNERGQREAKDRRLLRQLPRADGGGRGIRARPSTASNLEGAARERSAGSPVTSATRSTASPIRTTIRFTSPTTA